MEIEQNRQQHNFGARAGQAVSQTEPDRQTDRQADRQADRGGPMRAGPDSALAQSGNPSSA
eukprot:scaffold16814_cov69-Phaeocystis_antarctica.AAC.3